MRKTRWIAMLLAGAMLVSVMAPAALAAESFSDTQGHWAQPSVERWTGYGVVEGVGDGTFQPTTLMTRAQMAQVLARLLGLSEKAENRFSDVPAGAWYEDAILQCAAAGILKGTWDTTMSPDWVLTREQAAVMLTRALCMKEGGNPSALKDTGVSDWATGAMAAMVERGILKGKDGGRMAPQDEMSRAELVTVLDRAVAQYVNTPGQTVTAAEKGITLVAAANVTVTGKAQDLLLAQGAAGTTTLSGATVSGRVILEAPKATLVMKGDSRAAAVEVDAVADSAVVKLEKGAVVTSLTTGANGVKIAGEGKIEQLTVTGGANVSVDKGVAVTKLVNQSDSAVTYGSKTVRPGTSQVTATSSSVISSGGGSETQTKAPVFAKTVVTLEDGEKSATFKSYSIDADTTIVVKLVYSVESDTKVSTVDEALSGTSDPALTLDTAAHTLTLTWKTAPTKNQRFAVTAQARGESVSEATVLTVVAAGEEPPEESTARYSLIYKLPGFDAANLQDGDTVTLVPGGKATLTPDAEGDTARYRFTWEAENESGIWTDVAASEKGSAATVEAPAQAKKSVRYRCTATPVAGGETRVITLTVTAAETLSGLALPKDSKLALTQLARVNAAGEQPGTRVDLIYANVDASAYKIGDDVAILIPLSTEEGETGKIGWVNYTEFMKASTTMGDDMKKVLDENGISIEEAGDMGMELIQLLLPVLTKFTGTMMTLSGEVEATVTNGLGAIRCIVPAEIDQTYAICDSANETILYYVLVPGMTGGK